MPKLTIDGIEIEVEPGTSVLQACEQLGIEIPRFCYHERLSVPANCRMCLVEMERAPKPVASCAMPCADNMVIKTDTELVHKARKGVMEFLLINHPLDCPICDQGGECDLQDQAMSYGFDRGRYGENKRAVTEKYMGPLIKTFMTRCIHCTRCIRFGNEIAGVPMLGAVSRGEHMEITTFVEQAIASELSGNLVDVCPVGALTSKPYAYTARPWELRKTETIDVMDAVGSNIRVDTRGPEVMRVLPRLNEDVNEEWIGDKTRYHHDGLKRQRLDRPYLRVNGKLQPASWADAFAAIAARVKGLPGERIAAIAGDLVDVESMLALKDLMTALGSANIDCRQDGAMFDTSSRAGYLFNSTIAGIEQADAILLIGTNPRWEAPIVNARIRKRYLMGGLKVAVIGEQRDLTYPTTYLGAGTDTLSQLIDGNHSFAEVLRGAKKPMLILGAGALARPDGLAIQAAARALAESFGMVRDGWNGFNVLHRAAARVGGLDIGFVPGAGGRSVAGILDGAASGAVEVVYLLGADELDTDRLGNAFVIYQGHHGDRGAHRADVILPGAAYTEKNATYVNTEGRPQIARLATFPLGEAREDWKILRALSERLGHTLPYDSVSQLRARMVAVNPVFGKLGTVTPAAWGGFGTAGALDGAAFATPITNYYMTDPISRASETMARCTETFVRGASAAAEERTGTHG
ncbi:NADH-quinone oxidoreductase subunit G [Azospirillum sp. RWY-5-1]|uniref:NADH-quinone oxidoreductase n=1 Tax=Azospirillum oleiclasticum TaxID=2735135 RepID=A0ABX2T4Z8_9PROT|nr:NADH-quinone oxidoreductase subunit NuoG [Azospirillum oleiclasticum]NYZ12234.1 NADH-quinone oxidoreductase subunit G [Azospirillum oleiclasticum]NYZ19394.1 NADH-quinone oxidoreductase subunit G [Azospirillum oleiclasticum]